RPQPRVRARHARARCPAHRAHSGRDQGSPAAERDLLRRPGREPRLRDRAAGLRRRRRMTTTRTQVGIVGAGPAGLRVARLLERAGIESVVLEDRSRDYVEHRIRAGVLEQRTVDLLTEAGVAERLHREGIVHHGIELQFDGERHRIPLSELADGRTIVIYGQTEVVKDLIAARLESGLPLLFEVDEVTVPDLVAERPRSEVDHW